MWDMTTINRVLKELGNSYVQFICMPFLNREWDVQKSYPAKTSTVPSSKPACYCTWPK